MGRLGTRILTACLALGVAFTILNEIRGVIIAAPILYYIAASGGDAGVVLVGVSLLGGIALSVLIPAYVFRRCRSILRDREKGEDNE